MKISLLRPKFLLPLILLSGGCAHSPTIDVFGSYFPAWLVCIVVGIFITIIVRLLLIGFGVHVYLRFKFLTYLIMMIFFTLAVWLIFFKN